MNKTTTLFLMLAVLLLPAVATADNGWFMGASIGSAHVDEDVDGFRFDSSSVSYGLHGGYRLNDSFALEAGYLKLGDFDEQVDISGTPTSVSADADGFTFAIRAGVPLGERFGINARAGAFFWDGASAIAGVDDNVSDSNMFFGVGASYKFTETVALITDITRYSLDDTDSNVIRVGFEVGF